MTIIVALKGKISEHSQTEGIVMASDTQVTSNIKEVMQKIFQLNKLPILVGGAGSVSLSRHAVFRLEKLFLSSQDKLGQMSCDDFDLIANSRVKTCLKEIVESDSEIIDRDGFSLVLGFSDARKIRLYEVQEDGVPMRMDENPGYCCIGRGYGTGGRLLLQQFYSEDSDLLQQSRLARYIVSQVGTVDSSVSGVQIKLNFGGKVAHPTNEFFRDWIELRSETIRKVWNLLENNDKAFEKRFNEALENNELRKFIKSM